MFFKRFDVIQRNRLAVLVIARYLAADKLRERENAVARNVFFRGQNKPNIRRVNFLSRRQKAVGDQ